MRGNNDWLDVLETRQYLAHSFKGTTWGKHKYVDIRNGKYIYPEDLKAQRRASNRRSESGSVLRQRAAANYPSSQGRSMARRAEQARAQAERRAREQSAARSSAPEQPKSKNLFDGMGNRIAGLGSSALNAGANAAKAAGQGLSKLGNAVGGAAKDAYNAVTGEKNYRDYKWAGDRYDAVQQGAYGASHAANNARYELDAAKKSGDPERIKAAEAEYKRARNTQIMMEQEAGDAWEARNVAARKYVDNPGLFPKDDIVIISGPQAEGAPRNPSERTRQHMQKAAEAVGKTATKAAGAVSDAVKGAAGAAGEGAKNLFDAAQNGLEGAANAARGAVGAAGNALNAAGEGAKNLFNAAGQRISGAYGAARDAAGDLASGAQNLGSRAVDALGDLGETITGNNARKEYQEAYRQFDPLLRNGSPRTGEYENAVSFAQQDLEKARSSGDANAIAAAEAELRNARMRRAQYAQELGDARDRFNNAQAQYNRTGASVIDSIGNAASGAARGAANLFDQAGQKVTNGIADALGISDRADARDEERALARQRAIAEGDRRDYNDFTYDYGEANIRANNAIDSRNQAKKDLGSARAEAQEAGQQLESAQQALRYAMGTNDRSRIQFAQNAVNQMQARYDSAMSNLGRAESAFDNADREWETSVLTADNYRKEFEDRYPSVGGSSPFRAVNNTYGNMASDAHAKYLNEMYSQTPAGRMERFARDHGVDVNDLYDEFENWYRSRNGR